MKNDKPPFPRVEAAFSHILQSGQNLTIQTMNETQSKWIDFAYPTSIAAKKAGFSKTGCYFGHWGNFTSHESTKAFATLAEAKSALDSINLPFHRFSL